MNRLRTSATALLLVAPLTLTACSDAEDDVAPGPGDVQVPPVQAPDVDIPTESPS